MDDPLQWAAQGDGGLGEPGPWFNIKMSSYQYRKSHCGDKTVVRSSYLHNGISYTGKMASLYWIRAQQCNAFPNHIESVLQGPVLEAGVSSKGSKSPFKRQVSVIMITIYDTITFLQNTHNRHSDIKLWEVVCDLKVRTTSSIYQYCTFQNMMSYETCYFVNPFPGLRVAHHASRITMQLHKPEGRTGVQTFVWWALYIPYKFGKSPIWHLGLAIGNVWRFSPSLLMSYLGQHWFR